jgi:hypothetical protein
MSTDEEIAAWFGVSTRTIERRRLEPEFADVMDRGRAKGRISVRRLQMKLLEQGNATMGVWLGKNILNQVDQISVKHCKPESFSSSFKSISLRRGAIAHLLPSPFCRTRHIADPDAFLSCAHASRWRNPFPAKRHKQIDRASNWKARSYLSWPLPQRACDRHRGIHSLPPNNLSKMRPS